MRIYKSDEFPLDNDSLMLAETLFNNANGYLGVRGNFEEGYPKGYDSIRGQYINGFYDFVSMPQAEKLYGFADEKQTMLNVADTQGIRLLVEGEEFSLFEGKVLKRSRWLDMEQGITVREILWESPLGKVVNLRIKRMASFRILPLFLIEYRLTAVNFEGEVTILSSHNGEVMNYCDPNDPRVAGESVRHIFAEEISVEAGASFIAARTSKSNLSICSGVRNVFTLTGKSVINRQGSSITEQYTGRILINQPLTLYKYTVMCDSIRYENPKEAAERILAEAANEDVEIIYQSQKEYLDRFWKNCAIEIDGERDLNEAIHYNLYQLIQSVGKDPFSNIAAKGLSGEGYEGHYFWDTEMYIQPFFTMTCREISRNLIRYRYTILEYAKENAKILGHKKGAAYPWRTIMGLECSGYFPSGAAQYHINGDIAYSIVAYYLATKDLELLKECGAEILIETARLWMDLGNYCKGQFHINQVTGPDEYTCMVNNNYYTNVLAQYNLRWAVKGFRLLEQAGQSEELKKKTGVSAKELEEFTAAADCMYLPYDEELGINPQDDSFLQKKPWDITTIGEEEKPLLLHYHPMYLYRHQICKQADTVLAHFIFEDAQDTEVIRRSFAYYEKITTNDSSLSTCIYSIVAAKLGLEEKAYEYFGESAKMDLFNTHANTKDGIHTANMGGTYMAIVFGFGGLRIKETGLFISPMLPQKWQSYRFGFLYEDSGIQVEVTEHMLTVVLSEGTRKIIHVYGRKYVLEDRLEIAR